MNHVLQCVTHQPELSSHVLNSSCACGFCGVCLVAAHIQDALNEAEPTAIRPEGIFGMLPVLLERDAGEEEDAMEFFASLRLPCELLGGLQVISRTCTACQIEDVFDEPFADLGMPIPHFVDAVDDSFAHLASSVIDDYRCPMCESQSLCHEKLEFMAVPPVLTLQLGRFDGAKNKLTKAVTFPEMLDLAPFMFTKETALYELRSVILHLGSDSESGHYVAYCRTGQSHDSWVLFDDCYVAPATLEEVLSKKEEVYVLFYDRIV
jgi:ubiquitin C-terminal hydrolase